MSEYTEFNKELEDFYKKKSLYKKEYNYIKHTIVNNEFYRQLPRNEQQIAIRNIKQNCIQCKKKGGTKFIEGFDEEKNYRFVKMTCGNESSPCNLFSFLTIPKVYSFQRIIEEQESSIEQLKKDLINLKNKGIYGLITNEDAVKKYKEIKEQLSEVYMLHTSFFKDYMQIIENEQKEANKTEILLKIDEVLTEMRVYLGDFNDLQNTHSLKVAVNKYIHDLLPKLMDLRRNSYNAMFVHYNEDDNTFNLMQSKYTIADTEYFMDDPSVQKTNNKKETSSRLVAPVSDDIDWGSDDESDISKVNNSYETEDSDDDGMLLSRKKLIIEQNTPEESPVIESEIL